MVAIHLMMERRYPTKQGWLLFNEVRNKTGFGAGPEGFCDAMALSIWPSRGIALHGFEMKASRSDLIAELNQPAKADPFVRYCNFWWLVVEDAKLIEGLEIPQRLVACVRFGLRPSSTRNLGSQFSSHPCCEISTRTTSKSQN